MQVLEGRPGADAFVRYAARLVDISRASFASFAKKKYTITAARKYFSKVERQAAALASTLQRGERGYHMMLYNAHKLTGGEVERRGSDVYVFTPVRRISEIRKAAALIVQDADRVKGKRPASLFLIERLGYLATAYEHFLGRKPSHSINSLFYRVAAVIMDDLGLPASDIRVHLKAAMKARPSEIIRFSNP